MSWMNMKRAPLRVRLRQLRKRSPRWRGAIVDFDTVEHRVYPLCVHLRERHPGMLAEFMAGMLEIVEIYGIVHDTFGIDFIVADLHREGKYIFLLHGYSRLLHKFMKNRRDDEKVVSHYISFIELHPCNHGEMHSVLVVVEVVRYCESRTWYNRSCGLHRGGL